MTSNVTMKKKKAISKEVQLELCARIDRWLAKARKYRRIFFPNEIEEIQDEEVVEQVAAVIPEKPKRERIVKDKTNRIACAKNHAISKALLKNIAAGIFHCTECRKRYIPKNLYRTTKQLKAGRMTFCSRDCCATYLKRTQKGMGSVTK